MNFTREPIIETIITPREGFKLAIRNSKGGSQEEYFVDAVEVVSFGQSMFFRSQERPKSFLLPVTDYEVLEAKETRVVLKNAPLEGSIKIGGGRKVFRESEDKVNVPSKPQEEVVHGERPRRRKASSRRRRMEGEMAEGQPSRPPMEIKAPPVIPHTDQEKRAPIADKASGHEEEPQVSSTMFRSLFPPPPGLISEKIQYEKNLQAAREAAAVPSESAEAKPVEEKKEIPEIEDSASSFSDFVEEDSSSEEDLNAPRYHSAPRDEEGPSYRAENNFVY